MRILLIVALCVVGVSALDFSRHLTADHVHDHDYPFESRTAKREKNYEPPTPELEFPTLVKALHAIKFEIFCILLIL